jgi:hypothetical protein
MRQHNRERKKAAVVCQVRLFGHHVDRMIGKLSNMIECRCDGCDTKLLAEGKGYRAARTMARETGPAIPHGLCRLLPGRDGPNGNASEKPAPGR